jgi:hypothetical protein
VTGKIGSKKALRDGVDHGSFPPAVVPLHPRQKLFVAESIGSGARENAAHEKLLDLLFHDKSNSR